MARILVFLGLISLAFGKGWQDYINEDLIGKGLQHAAILGRDGSLWVKSKGFSLRAGESRALLSLYKNPSSAYSKGIAINGIKYIAIRADERSIYGKKGLGGVIIVKTTETMIIGVYNQLLQPGKAALICEKLGDHLINNGY